MMETNLDLSYQAMQLRWLRAADRSRHDRPSRACARFFALEKTQWRDRGKRLVSFSVEGPGTGHLTLSLGLGVLSISVFAAAVLRRPQLADGRGFFR